MKDGARADGGQQFLGVLSKQDEGSVFGRLFEDLEQAVGGLFHKCRGGEDGEGSLGFDRGAVVGDVDDLADLADLDEQLRRVRRDDEHVGVGLDEDAGFALVGIAHVVAGLDGFSDQCFKVGGACDASAVGACAAEIGKAVGFGGVQTVDGLGQHEGQRVFTCSTGAGEDERVGKTRSRCSRGDG